MGNHRAKRAAFFADHPTCCFCGGLAVATEIDHIPARHLFRDRQWPEGYEFPACSDCNRSSSLDELSMGWLVRIQIDDYTAQDEREMTQALTKLHRRRPEWIHALKELSRNETKRHLKAQGLRAASFAGGEVFMMEMPDELHSAPQRYAEKLGRALYYKVTGRPIPASGGVNARAMTNTEWLSPRFKMDGFEILGNQPPITRAGRDLTDQFAYRYAVVQEGTAAGFLIQFRQSIFMFVLAYEDEKEYLEVKARRESSAIADSSS